MKEGSPSENFIKPQNIKANRKSHIYTRSLNTFLFQGEKKTPADQRKNLRIEV